MIECCGMKNHRKSADSHRGAQSTATETATAIRPDTTEDKTQKDPIEVVQHPEGVFFHFKPQIEVKQHPEGVIFHFEPQK